MSSTLLATPACTLFTHASQQCRYSSHDSHSCAGAPATADSLYACGLARQIPLAERRQRVLTWSNDADKAKRVDLRPIMELSPLAVMHTTPLPRIHRLFHLLGLRHLYVTDTRNQVVGVITRKDLLPEVLEANATDDPADVNNESATPFNPILGASTFRRRSHLRPRTPASPRLPCQVNMFVTFA